MSFGLVLGGGGVVGLAWEVGVLAGLAEVDALDPRKAGLTIGTSAGSIIGSRLGLGASVSELFDEQTKPLEMNVAVTAPPDPAAAMQAFNLWSTADPMTQERAAAIGDAAIRARPDGESDWISTFETMLGPEWPEIDLRVVAVACDNGERAVWTRESGVALALAVASSCAVPALFPTVPIGGRRYTDGGVWSSGSADLLLGTGVTAAVFLGPMVGSSGVGRVCSISLASEAAALDSAGIKLISVTPGETFEKSGITLMDFARRGEALELGFKQGQIDAERVSEVAA